MPVCHYKNTFEITYNSSEHNLSSNSHFYENIIQISRCPLLKPEWCVNSDEFLKVENLMEKLWTLPDTRLKELNYLNHPLCDGKDCKLGPNKDVREVIVGLSYACNLNCHHCLYEGRHFDTSLQKQIYFYTLNSIKGNKLDKITLTNKGEPFFYLSETMNYLRNFSKNDASCVSCITNGNCFGKSQIEELLKISNNNGFMFNFVFSIDAITKNVYERVRCGGDFDKVLKNLEQCIKNFGAENVIVSFCTNKINYNEAFQVRDFYAHNFGIRTDITVDYFDQELLKKSVVS